MLNEAQRLMTVVETMAELINIGVEMAEELQDRAADAVEASGDEADGAYLREVTARWRAAYQRYEALNG